MTQRGGGALLTLAAVLTATAAHAEIDPSTIPKPPPPAVEPRVAVEIPPRALVVRAPDTAFAGESVVLVLEVTDAAGRPPEETPRARPVFASPGGVQPVVGNCAWSNGACTTSVALLRVGLEQTLAVRVGELTAEVRLDVLAQPTTAADALAEAEERLAHGDTSGALAALRAARDLAPDDGDVWQRLGAVATRLGRWEEALAAFRRSLELTLRKNRDGD